MIYECIICKANVPNKNGNVYRTKSLLDAKKILETNNLVYDIKDFRINFNEIVGKILDIYIKDDNLIVKVSTSIKRPVCLAVISRQAAGSILEIENAFAFVSNKSAWGENVILNKDFEIE